MSGPAGMWLALLADVSIKGLVVLLFAGAAAFLARRASAAVRHLVWCLAVGGLLVLPILSVTLPDWRVRIPAVMPVDGAAAATDPVPAGANEAAVTDAVSTVTDAVSTASDDVTAAADARSTAPIGEAGPVDGGARTGEGGMTDSEGHAGALAETPGSFESPATFPEPDRAVIPVAPGAQSQANWGWIALGTWLAGVLAVLATLGAGLWKVRRFAARARSLKMGRAASLNARIAPALGVRRHVKLLEGDGLAMPMTWGLLRPVVLLPAGAESWPCERLEAVLLHELAHVRRGDYATQLLAEIVCALYWFNPLVWLAARRLRIEREHACDDYVLSSGSKASDYAGQLLELARSLKAQRATAMAAMAMARPSQLTGRLLAVLDEHRSRTAISGKRAAWALIAALR